MLLCKDRNFKANHNAQIFHLTMPMDVCYSAKIGILKNFKANHNRFLFVFCSVFNAFLQVEGRNRRTD